MVNAAGKNNYREWGVGCDPPNPPDIGGAGGVWGSGVWGSGVWGVGRINKNNLLSPVSCLLSPDF